MNETVEPAEPEVDSMLAEYDFSGGVRGKYAGRLAANFALVALDPDVAEVFPDAEAVNEALRDLIRLDPDRRRKK